ncbi:uncharacterized protein LOC141912027 isoform X2 [Tubulanus polymorphus]|uniref:uncharacterized protein LOC141912027 isoform X2 n=1 Tax=Tubulanus polymorphus TaxID=672921 RepID=UPI003DA23005
MTTPLVILSPNDLALEQQERSQQQATVVNITEAEWSVATQIGLEMTMIFAWILAFFGNLLVIAVVVRHEGMRTRTNIFIANLAIADFLVSVLNMPFSFVTVITRRWVFGSVMCQINGFAMLFFFCVSVHTLMYISVHKYVTITHPFSERHKMTYAKVGVMIAATYVISGILCVLTNFVLNHVLYKRNTSQCGPAYPNNPQTYVHTAIISAFTYIIPLIIMIVAYIRIFIEIRAYSKRLTVHSNMDRHCILTRQKRATVTLVIVMCVFLLCWTPYFFYANYSTALVSRGKKVPPFLNPICYWFGYINSACNPIIYGLRSPSFREGYKRIFCFSKKIVISTDDSAVAGDNSVMNRLSVIVQGMQKITKKDAAIASLMIAGATNERGRKHGTVVTPTDSSNIVNKIGDDLPIVYTKNGKIVKIQHRKISRNVANNQRRSSEGDAVTPPIEGSTGRSPNADVSHSKGFSYPDLMCDRVVEEKDENLAFNETSTSTRQLMPSNTIVTVESTNVVAKTTTVVMRNNDWNDRERSPTGHHQQLRNKKKCFRSVSETRYDHKPSVKRLPKISVNFLDADIDRIDRLWRISARELEEIRCDMDDTGEYLMNSFPSLEHLDCSNTSRLLLMKSRSDSYLEGSYQNGNETPPGACDRKHNRPSKLSDCLKEADTTNSVICV